MISSKSVPDPFSGMKPEAEMCRVLVVPVPMMLAETLQLLEVSPAGRTYGLWKMTTDDLKVKSPWKLR